MSFFFLPQSQKCGLKFCQRAMERILGVRKEYIIWNRLRSMNDVPWMLGSSGTAGMWARWAGIATHWPEKSEVYPRKRWRDDLYAFKNYMELAHDKNVWKKVGEDLFQNSGKVQVIFKKDSKCLTATIN